MSYVSSEYSSLIRSLAPSRQVFVQTYQLHPLPFCLSLGTQQTALLYICARQRHLRANATTLASFTNELRYMYHILKERKSQMATAVALSLRCNNCFLIDGRLIVVVSSSLKSNSDSSDSLFVFALPIITFLPVDVSSTIPPPAPTSCSRFVLRYFALKNKKKRNQSYSLHLPSILEPHLDTFLFQIALHC